ncbi:MAG: Holliday junction resolvase RuvX [Pseudomonadales bacterium]|nr:Holliday junction resolvase RuvX [Pseudomonadales bacterium]
MMSKKILAIDYGTVRVGLAVSYGTLAEPLQVIANNEKIFENLGKIIEGERVEEIVVGVSENEMAQQTLDFVEKLKQLISLPIHTSDETLSSFEVEQKLKVLKKSKRDGEIDHYAATIILQNYLDSL